MVQGCLMLPLVGPRRAAPNEGGGKGGRRKPRETGQPSPAITPCPSRALSLHETPPAREAHLFPVPGDRRSASPCPSRAEQSREVTRGARGQDAALAATAGIVSLDTWGMKSEPDGGAQGGG